MRKIKNLVIGCGLSGAVIAEQVASRLNEEVLVIDRRNHIGGNVYDDTESGITVHRYGPHVFHTNDSRVWRYLSRFTEWHRFMYKVRAYIDGHEVPVPFNLNTLYRLFPPNLAGKLEEALIGHYGYGKRIPILELQQVQDANLNFLADYIYRKVFLGYTAKQWGVRLEELDFSVSARVPVMVSRDDRYFHDRYQGIPADGYTQLVGNIINHPKIKVELETDYLDIRDGLAAERIFYSGAIDEYFDYCYGQLPYRSLDIQFRKFDCEYYQSTAQVNFPDNYDYTRSVEYKYYLNQKSPQTIVSFEYPEPFEKGMNERFYPIPNEENDALFSRYQVLADQEKKVFFVGRLGHYRYYNMDQVVMNALSLVDSIVEKDGGSHEGYEAWRQI